MHIVTRPTMLTLTVERLVGNNNGHSHRMTMSPDSSDTGSETSSIITSTKLSSSPSHFSKISLLLSSNGTRSPTPSRLNDDPSPRVTSQVSTSLVKNEEDPNQERLIEDGGGGDGESHEPQQNVTSYRTSGLLKKEDRGDKEDFVGRDESSDLGTSGNHPRLTDNGNGGSGDGEGEGDDKDDRVVVRLCDDERPPSSASSSSTWSNSWGSSINNTSSILSQPNHNYSPGPCSTINNSPKLKFSIHDILRPDFGQRAITKIQNRRPYHHHHLHPGGVGHGPVATSSVSPHNKLDSENNEQNGSVGIEKRQSRPSSVKNHSEDSNSSCSSSRREEVVDEAKVNPEVPKGPLLWPAWVYCTRYSDRPSSGPRSRRIVRKAPGSTSPRSQDSDEKRPRTAFTAEQLGKLKQEFDENRYLTEKRRQDLARDLKLHENQIKIWFQNKRAKLKKSTGQRGGLAIQLMAQGLYNHSTVPMDEDEDYLPC